MKLTNEQLKQIIKEELENAIDEGLWDSVKGFASKTVDAVKGEVEPIAKGLKDTTEKNMRGFLNQPENKKMKEYLEWAENSLATSKEKDDLRYWNNKVRAIARHIEGLEKYKAYLKT